MRKHTVMLSALVAAFASFAAPFTDGGVTYTPNNEVSRYQPVVTGVNVTGMVESVAYTKSEVDRRIETNAPVRSVNGMRGNVRLGAREVGALPDNRAYLEDDANFVNAVRNVQVKPGDSERVLPPYLHEIEFDSTYPDDAKWYYEQADYSNAGMCSVRRTGNVVERNFDWKFDFMPEFVVRTVAAGGRFASIGVANIGDLLTEADVSKGWSPYYRCLPGHMTDGVNESGVFVEVNVVDGEPDWGNPGGDIHPLGAVRWVLDYGTNAQQAAGALASRIAFPAGWSQNFHYMIADASGTYIVENGVVSSLPPYTTAVMTNFKLYPDRDTDGAGQERYNLLAGGEPITNAWWTLAYLRETSPVRVSDIGTDTNAVFAAWGRGDRESHRGQVIGGQTWWQTVHTAVYDIGAKSLRICVQEKAEWYEFVLHTGGGGGGSDAGARRLEDNVAHARSFGEWKLGELKMYNAELRYVGDDEWELWVYDRGAMTKAATYSGSESSEVVSFKSGSDRAPVLFARDVISETNDLFATSSFVDGHRELLDTDAYRYSDFSMEYSDRTLELNYVTNYVWLEKSAEVPIMLYYLGDRTWGFGWGPTRNFGTATGGPNDLSVDFGNGVVATRPSVFEKYDKLATNGYVDSKIKDCRYDPTLGVTWTNAIDNGHIYYVTVTNTNIVTP